MEKWDSMMLNKFRFVKLDTITLAEETPLNRTNLLHAIKDFESQGYLVKLKYDNDDKINGLAILIPDTVDFDDAAESNILSQLKLATVNEVMTMQTNSRVLIGGDKTGSYYGQEGKIIKQIIADDDEGTITWNVQLDGKTEKNYYLFKRGCSPSAL